MMSLINKSADWPSRYHKTARAFPKLSAPLHKLTLKEPAIMSGHYSIVRTVFKYSVCNVYLTL